MVKRALLAGVLVAGALLQSPHYAAAVDWLSQVSFSPLRTLEPNVRLTGKKERVAIEANDISVGANGEVWVASQHGVFRKKGADWEQVRTTSTTIFSENILWAKRIDVDAQGNPWVIDEKGILYKRVYSESRKEYDWIRILSEVKDVGAGKTGLWLIPTDDSRWVKSGGMVVLNASFEGAITPSAWQSALGKPVAVDVDEYSVPHVATASGKLATRLPSGGVWYERATCVPVDGRKCDPTVFSDIAASNRALWIASTTATLHYAGEEYSSLGRLLPLAPALKSVASDPLGNLYGINARKEVVFGEISYDYQSGGDVLVAATIGMLPPELGRMTKFDASSSVLAVDIPDPKAGEFDYQAALNPANDLTVSFSIYPPAAPDAASGSNCIISYRSTRTEYFSICLDALHQKMTVAVGVLKETFPIQLRGETKLDFDGTKFTPVDVGRKFIFRSKLGHATMETVSAPQSVIDGKPNLAKATYTRLAEMDLPANMKFDKGGARLYVGSRDGVADKYQGYLGTVRVFDGAVEVNNLFAHWRNGEKAVPSLPGYPGLLVEAVLNPQNKEAGVYSVALNRPIDFSGFWYRLGTGEYYSSRKIDKDPKGPAWRIGRIEVFKIEHVAQASPLSPQRLRIARDGEGGVVTTSFEQSGEKTYQGWQDPASKQLGEKGYELSLFDANTVTVRNVANGKELYSLGRVPPYQEKAAPARKIQSSPMNYAGYDILQVSPYMEIDTGNRKENVFDDPGDGATRGDDRKVPSGLLYTKIDKGEAQNLSHVTESTRQMQEDLALSIGASIEVPEVVAFSRQATFKKEVEEMSNQKSMRARGEMYWAGHALILDPARMKLAAGFLSAVNQAKADLKANSREGLVRLVNIYGTHYTNHVICGSRARSEKAISEQGVERVVKERWGVEAKNSGTVKGVKLGLDVSFEMGKGSQFHQATVDEKSKTTVASGTTSFDTEEVMVGEDVERCGTIALDLRPLSDLLSPIYFDDPHVYTELRQALTKQIALHVGESAELEGLSNTSFVPIVWSISIDKFIPKKLGDGSVSGKISLFVLKPGQSSPTQRVLWEGTSGKPTDAESGEVIIAKNHFISIVPTPGNVGSMWIEADLKGADSAGKFTQVTQDIPIGELHALRQSQITGSFTSVADSCTCVTACPEGYEDDSGQCLKKCPDGFTKDGSTCKGVKYMGTYLAGEMDKCKAQNPTSGCEHHGLYIQPVCPANYTAVGFGACYPICSKFGLDKWGGTDVNCLRPEKSRTNSGRSPSNQCPTGAVPGNDCSRIKVQYTVTQIKFDEGE